MYATAAGNTTSSRFGRNGHRICNDRVPGLDCGICAVQQYRDRGGRTLSERLEFILTRPAAPAWYRWSSRQAVQHSTMPDLVHNLLHHLLAPIRRTITE